MRRLDRLPDGNRSVAQQVATVVRRLIVSGELPPGERLGQEWLCDELGVSPAPVREALRQLEAEGLVEHRPNRGVFVLELSDDELIEVVAPTRFLLEHYAVRRALSHDKGALISSLEQILSEMEKGAIEGNLEVVNDTDVRFHEQAIIVSGQPHTLQLWRSITPRLRAQFARLAPRMKSPEEILKEHRELLEAIQEEDLTRIQTTLHAHTIEALPELLRKEKIDLSEALAGGEVDS